MDQQTQSQTETQPQQRINPLQILVNAAFLAYQRGAFSMKETSIISQSIDFFIETKQAVVPQPQPPQQQQPQNQQQAPMETIKEEPTETQNPKIVMLSQ